MGFRTRPLVEPERVTPKKKIAFVLFFARNRPAVAHSRAATVSSHAPITCPAKPPVTAVFRFCLSRPRRVNLASLLMSPLQNEIEARGQRIFELVDENPESL